MKGYKAFNKDWTSKNRNFKYEIGKTYETQENLIMCQKGFHFCINSCDVLNYYSDADCKYAIIEAEGEIQTEGDKSVCNKITIVKEITKNDLLQAHKEIIKKPSTTGRWAHSSTTGNWANSSTTGENSISIACGILSKVKGEKGFIFIADWREKNDKWYIQKTYTAKVGEKILRKTIKPNYWYWFQDGKLMEEKAE